MMTPLSGQPTREGKASSEGFSLLELLVAMGIFLLVSGVAFTLFNQQQAVLSAQQGTVGLNVGLRNALAQMQLDLVNAGNGLILGTNVPAWPVGVTIVNNPNPSTGPCNPTATNPPVYAAACFDQLNIIVVDPNTPPLHPCVGSGCTVVTDGSPTITLYGQFNSPYTASTYAGNFQAGDQVLLVQSCAAAGGKEAVNSSGCMFTTATLAGGGTVNTGAPGCAAGCVQLTFHATLTPAPPTIPPTAPYAGSNTPCPTPPPSPNTCNDPLNMTSYAPYTELTDSFGPNDWVVRLLPISYSVNASHVDGSGEPDPQLIRTQAGKQNAVMEEVVTFKVGAALWNNWDTSTFQYNYTASSYTTGNNPPGTNAYQFNLIRSVRVSIIGRTQPDPTNPFRNSFDSGPYQIRGNSIIVNPRNLTMNSD